MDDIFAVQDDIAQSVVEELRAHPAPDSYIDYLRLKLRQDEEAADGYEYEFFFRSHDSRFLKFGWFRFEVFLKGMFFVF